MNPPNTLDITAHRVKLFNGGFVQLLGVFGAILIWLTIQFFYGFYSVHFDYFGLDQGIRNPREIILAFLFLVGIAGLIPYRTKQPGDLLLLLMFVLGYLPCNAFYCLDQHAAEFAFFGLSLTYFAVLIFYRLIQGGRALPFPRLSINHMFILLFILVLGFTSILYMEHGFRITITSMDQLYDLRDTFKANSNRFTVYLFNWVGYVFNTLLWLIALRYRKYWLALIALGIQCYLFSLGGHKAIIALFPFVTILYVLVGKFKLNLGIATISAVALTVLGLVVVDWLMPPFTWASSIMVWRGLIMPAQLYFDYADFSMYYSLDHFRQSFPFSALYESHYSETIPILVGKEYLIRERDIHANANIFADLLVNIGYWAFVVGGVFLLVLTTLINKLSVNKDPKVVIPFVCVSIVGLLNSGFIVNFVTHGLIWIVLLLALLPTIKNKTVIKTSSINA